MLRVDALDAVSVVCKGIWHVQTALETTDHVTVIKVIQMSEEIKASLRLVSSGVMDSVSMIVPSLPARELATVALMMSRR